MSHTQETREDTQTPEQISKAQDLAARLQDAQYLTEEYSGIVHVNNLPLPLPSHLSKRELKRAARQIHKLLGDGSLDWYEGWANSGSCDSPSGLLAFGEYLDNKHNKQCPKNARYGFSSWLWKCAEALGYECTDQDQTSRCEDCNLAIDTGSSTPDYYSFQCECSIVCNKCLNNGIIGTSINQSPHGRLTWKPGDQNDNYLQATEGNLIHVVFESDSAMESFAKDHLVSPSELWYRESYGYHGSSILCWFRHENLKDSCLKSYGKPDEWAVYRARISWPQYSRYEDNCPVRDFWELVEREVSEDEYPLLSYLAKGKIEEGLLFHCEVELLSDLFEQFNSNRYDSGKLESLAHSELQLNEIEEG